MNDAPATPKIGRPWGFWATVGFSAIVAAVFLTIQIAVLIVFLIVVGVENGDVAHEEFACPLERNGFLLSVATLASTPVATGLVVLFAALRKGISARDYLGLRAISWREMLRWMLILGALIVVYDVAMVILGRPIVPEFMLEAYQTAKIPLFLWLALVAAAPIFEEIFFRGFVFAGILHSRLGAAGAILLTSLTWAAIHVQYDAFDMTVIFLAGLLFGWARLRTNSLLPCIAMHALMNFVATVEVVVVLARG
jgi:membrane protease YdiL (CAAX protease family)